MALSIKGGASLKGIKIGVSAAPPEVNLRTTSGTMTYWSVYNAAASPTAVGGNFDPTTVGTNGTLSNSNFTFTFSGESSVLGSYPVAPWASNFAWEFLVNTDYNIQLGYFAYEGAAYNPNGSSQARGSYYQSNGNIFGPGGNSGPGASYTTGDIIGVVFKISGNRIEFYKNGTYQGYALSQNNLGSVLVSGVATSPAPPLPPPVISLPGGEIMYTAGSPALVNITRTGNLAGTSSINWLLISTHIINTPTPTTGPPTATASGTASFGVGVSLVTISVNIGLMAGGEASDSGTMTLSSPVNATIYYSTHDINWGGGGGGA